MPSIAIVRDRIRVVEPFLSRRTSSRFDTSVASGECQSRVFQRYEHNFQCVYRWYEQNNIDSRSSPWRRQHFIELSNVVQTLTRNSRDAYHATKQSPSALSELHEWTVKLSLRLTMWNIKQLRQFPIDWSNTALACVTCTNVSNNNVIISYKQNR